MAIESQTQSTQIHNLGRDEIARFKALSDEMGYIKETDYFERNFDHVEKGEREALIVTHEDRDAGYCFLNWSPKYALFRKMEIPEIQDLSIVPDMRRRGLGTKIIEFCEQHAKNKKASYIGLGVSVNSTYGAAQILYTKLGYIPDGNGVTYDRALVAAGDFKPLDDQLCLMMTKQL